MIKRTRYKNRKVCDEKETQSKRVTEREEGVGTSGAISKLHG